MSEKSKNNTAPVVIDSLALGYRNGIRRGEVTKGQRLTEQITAMLDLLVSNTGEDQSRDFKIGEIIGLVQWVEENRFTPDDTKSPT